MHVIIIGAGIGGLCSAIALQRLGIEATVYERSPTLQTSGAGISLWPNATKILQQWGMLDSLLEQGSPITRTRIASPQGTPLTEVDITAFDVPAVCIQRQQLQLILQAQLSPESVRWSHTLTHFECPAHQVTAQFQTGHSATADLLIGADGIHSTVRHLWSIVPPSRYHGYVAWRGVVNQRLPNWPTGLAVQYWGKGQRFGLLAMGSNQMYWFASLNADHPQTEGLSQRKQYLLDCFRSWNRSVLDAITLSDESDILVHPISTPPLPRDWHNHCLVLLGDAAHAITPNLGQGACMAIEDAETLAYQLQQAPSISQALNRYAQRRQPRVRRVMLRSQLLGQMGQWNDSGLVTLRSLGLKLAPNWIPQLAFQTLFKNPAPK